MNIEITTGDRELAMQALPVDEHGAPIDLKAEEALEFVWSGPASGAYWGPITARWESIAGIITKARRVDYLRGQLDGLGERGRDEIGTEMLALLDHVFRGAGE